MELAGSMSDRVTAPPPIERLIAVGYGLTYDAIVRGFGPYEALLDEIVALVGRAATPGPPSSTRVLDVSCGVGTVAERLARRGWSVVAVDPIEHLVAVARRHHRDSGLSLSFHHADVAKLLPLTAAVVSVLLIFGAMTCVAGVALLVAALFELFRNARPRYLSREQFADALRTAGFEVLEMRATFLAGISLLAWTRATEGEAPPRG